MLPGGVETHSETPLREIRGTNVYSLMTADPEIIPGGILAENRGPESIPGNILSYDKGSCKQTRYIPSED